LGAVGGEGDDAGYEALALGAVSWRLVLVSLRWEVDVVRFFMYLCLSRPTRACMDRSGCFCCSCAMMFVWTSNGRAERKDCRCLLFVCWSETKREVVSSLAGLWIAEESGSNVMIKPESLSKGISERIQVVKS
jgi:hypothetical protein